MHESLFQYVARHTDTPLSVEERRILEEIFVPTRLRRREPLLHAGEVCRYAAFIIKGAMRQYSVDEKGVEHTVYLALENWWAVDRESFTMLSPSRYSIMAWEQTDVLLISKADSVRYVDQIPAMKKLSQVLNEKNSFALMNRVNSGISLSAEQRFDWLQQTYPQFLQRFPQHIVASYLGITKETLSRIRSERAKR